MENAKSVRPLPGHIVLEIVEIEQTNAGLSLPDSQKQQSSRGTVVAIGEEWVDEHGVMRRSPVKVGEVVIYRKYSAEEVEVEWKKYIPVKFADLQAVIE